MRLHVYSVREGSPGFQLTHPTRSATSSSSDFIIKSEISTHAPHAECDIYIFWSKVYSFISTHAPHAECDNSLKLFPAVCRKFQLTHPTRSATSSSSDFIIKSEISTHAPHAECDIYIFWSKVYSFISTHAPHAECDNSLKLFPAVCRKFQLTHPTRSATCSGSVPP